MGNQETRAALERHWAAAAAGGQDAEYEIYCDDSILDYPQSGERIRSHHPSKPSGFVIRRMLGEGSLWVTECAITYDGRPVPSVSIMEFRDDKVAREMQYFADPFEAPAWRAQWVEVS